MTLIYDLYGQSLQVVVMTYTQTKDQSERSDGSKDRVETNRQTELVALTRLLTSHITHLVPMRVTHANAVTHVSAYVMGAQS